MKRLEDMTEVELRDLMNDLARGIQDGCARRDVAGRGTGGKPMFVLLLFDDPRVTQYVASCQREDVVAAMRETADRLGNREDTPR